MKRFALPLLAVLVIVVAGQATVSAQAPVVMPSALEATDNKLKIKVVFDPKDNNLKKLNVWIVGKNGGAKMITDDWSDFANMNTVESPEYKDVPKGDYTMVFLMKYVKTGASEPSYAASTSTQTVKGKMGENLGTLGASDAILGNDLAVYGAYDPPKGTKWRTKGNANLYFFPANALVKDSPVAPVKEAFSKTVSVVPGTYIYFWRVEVVDDAGASKGFITSKVVTKVVPTPKSN